MPAAENVAKAPSDVEDATAEEDEETRTGRFTTSDYGTWFGNAIVLASVGTIALVVTAPAGSDKGLAVISDLLIACALFVLLWASYKYFLAGRKRRHWTAYAFIIALLTTLAALIWLAIVV